MICLTTGVLAGWCLLYYHVYVRYLLQKFNNAALGFSKPGIAWRFNDVLQCRVRTNPGIDKVHCLAIVVAVSYLHSLPFPSPFSKGLPNPR